MQGELYWQADPAAARVDDVSNHNVPDHWVLSLKRMANDVCSLVSLCVVLSALLMQAMRRAVQCIQEQQQLAIVLLLWCVASGSDGQAVLIHKLITNWHVL